MLFSSSTPPFFGLHTHTQTHTCARAHPPTHLFVLSVSVYVCECTCSWSHAAHNHIYTCTSFHRNKIPLIKGGLSKVKNSNPRPCTPPSPSLLLFIPGFLPFINGYVELELLVQYGAGLTLTRWLAAETKKERSPCNLETVSPRPNN